MSTSSNAMPTTAAASVVLASLLLSVGCNDPDSSSTSVSGTEANGDGDGDGDSGDGDGDSGDGDGSPGDGDGGPGDGDGSPGDGDGDGGPGDGDGDGSPQDPDPNCPDHTIDGALPITEIGSNAGEGNGHDPSCGNPLGEDLAFLWVAPSDGQFRIDTFGSSYDTVLAVYAGMCVVESELACNDDAPDTTSSRVVLQLAQGDAVTIYLDAYDDAAIGDYVLHIDELICPMIANLGMQLPLQQSGMLDAGAGQDQGECGGAGNEAMFLWTAPADGNYVFDSFGSDYDTVLYLRDGNCGGAELDCNDDFGGLQSQVSIDLTSGQTVYIVLDAASDQETGNYLLNIAMN